MQEAHSVSREPRRRDGTMLMIGFGKCGGGKRADVLITKVEQQHHRCATPTQFRRMIVCRHCLPGSWQKREAPLHFHPYYPKFEYETEWGKRGQLISEPTDTLFFWPRTKSGVARNNSTCNRQSQRKKKCYCKDNKVFILKLLEGPSYGWRSTMMAVA